PSSARGNYRVRGPAPAPSGGAVLRRSGERRSARRIWSVRPHGRDDADIPPELEHEVVELSRRDGPQGGQLCRRLVLVEHVERPVAQGAPLKVRVVEAGSIGRADDDRV